MKKTTQTNSIKMDSAEARLVGSIVFGDRHLACRLEQSAYERFPQFLAKAMRCNLEGDIPTVQRRMMKAGLSSDEAEYLLTTAEQALNAAYRAGPQRWAEGGGVSQHMPPSEVFEQAHQDILQQPKRKEI